jgi:hypothetical protein
MAFAGMYLPLLYSRNDYSIINELMLTSHSLTQRLWRYRLS